MILGWTSDSVPGAVLAAPLPVPHVATYRDGEIVTPAPNAITEMIVSGGIGGIVEARAGATSDNEAALLVELQILEVFHAFLLDYIAYHFGWLPCEDAPETDWESCTTPPKTEWR